MAAKLLDKSKNLSEEHTVQTIVEPTTGTWALDPTHTEITVIARHLMAAKVRGSFKSFQGTISMGDSPETSSVEVTVDAASIDTGVEDRDTHLRSPDFLDVDQFETLEFRSTSVKQVGKDRYKLFGDLTIKEVTNPIEMDLEYGGIMTDPWGNEKAIFSASGAIERELWGLTWNVALETGGFLVGKTFRFEIEAQAAAV